MSGLAATTARTSSSPTATDSATSTSSSARVRSNASRFTLTASCPTTYTSSSDPLPAVESLSPCMASSPSTPRSCTPAPPLRPFLARPIQVCRHGRLLPLGRLPLRPAQSGPGQTRRLPEQWAWSSAAAHLGEAGWPDWLDRPAFESRDDAQSWRDVLASAIHPETQAAIRQATRRNRPLAQPDLGPELGAAVRHSSDPAARRPASQIARCQCSRTRLALGSAGLTRSRLGRRNPGRRTGVLASTSSPQRRDRRPVQQSNRTPAGRAGASHRRNGIISPILLVLSASHQPNSPQQPGTMKSGNP